MASITEQIDVQVPVRTAYNQWTQFEEFPHFMEGVKEVRQVDDAHLHWVAQSGDAVAEWQAEIIEQVPDQIIAWRSTDGRPNSGTVRFEEIGANDTRVHVDIEYETEGFSEGLGAAVGADGRRTKADLERFKELIESREIESGSWRGEIHGGQVAGRSDAFTSRDLDEGYGVAGLEETSEPFDEL